MSWGHRSWWMEFVFLAYPSQSELHVLSFLGVSLVYTWVITRNVLVMVAIQTEAHLHTTMYYFLVSFSGVEIGYTAVVVPTSWPTSYGQRRPSPCLGHRLSVTISRPLTEACVWNVWWFRR